MSLPRLQIIMPRLTGSHDRKRPLHSPSLQLFIPTTSPEDLLTTKTSIIVLLTLFISFPIECQLNSDKSPSQSNSKSPHLFPPGNFNPPHMLSTTTESNASATKRSDLCVVEMKENNVVEDDFYSHSSQHQSDFMGLPTESENNVTAPVRFGN